MKKYRMFLLGLFLPMFGCMLCEGKENNDQQNALHYFQKGNRLYGEQKWAEAAKTYQAALKYGQSASLHFNLGNVYVRLNKPGKAYYHFKKALVLSPNWTLPKENLAYLNGMLMPSRSLPFSFLQKCFHFLTWNVWTLLACTATWCTLFGALIYLFSSRKRRGAYLWIIIFGALTSLFLSALPLINLRELSRAVALENTALKFAPTEQSPVRRELLEGTECTWLETKGSFAYINLLDEKSAGEGWVEKEKLGRLFE